MLSKSVQPRPSVVNMTLPAFAAAAPCCGAVAAETPELQGARGAGDCCLLPAGRSAANPPHAPLLLPVDGTDRRTDRRTDRQTLDRFIDLAARTGSTGRRELVIGFRLNCRKYIVKIEHFRLNKLITNRPSTVSQCTGCILRRMSIHTRS